MTFKIYEIMRYGKRCFAIFFTSVHEFQSNKDNWIDYTLFFIRTIL